MIARSLLSPFDLHLFNEGTHSHLFDKLGAHLSTEPEGTSFAVWAPNEWRWPVIACGTYCAGAVLVPISTRFGAFEAGDILTRANVKALFVVDGFVGNSALIVSNNAPPQASSGVNDI